MLLWSCTFYHAGCDMSQQACFAPTLQFECCISSTQGGRCSAATSTMNLVCMAKSSCLLRCDSYISPPYCTLHCGLRVILPPTGESAASTPAGCCYHSSASPVRLRRVATCIASSTTRCLALCKPQGVSCHWHCCVHHARTVVLLPAASHSSCS